MSQNGHNGEITGNYVESLIECCNSQWMIDPAPGPLNRCGL